MINSLINMAMQNKFQTMPEMQIFNQFFSGKSMQDQMQTLLNMANEKGVDINEKKFSAEDLKQLGFKLD